MVFSKIKIVLQKKWQNNKFETKTSNPSNKKNINENIIKNNFQKVILLKLTKFWEKLVQCLIQYITFKI